MLCAVDPHSDWLQNNQLIQAAKSNQKIHNFSDSKCK